MDAQKAHDISVAATPGQLEATLVNIHADIHYRSKKGYFFHEETSLLPKAVRAGLVASLRKEGFKISTSKYCFLTITW